MTGQRISHYEILDKLGEGGMGAVYSARDTHLNRTVALKILPPHVAGLEDARRRFVQEARAASALNHPGIVTIHDIDSADGVDFIAMELVAGQTLDRAVQPGGLPLAKALDYALQICDALARAHDAGIVHRDLKPRNIMVTAEGRVKILDFGLAKLVHPESAEDEATRSLATDSTPLTKKGMVLGTVAYMSPEQAEGKPVDQRTDVFSFGVVLYEMLCGRKAFLRDSTLGTLTAILHDEPAPVEALRRDVPLEVRKILQRALRKNPAKRYASAREARLDLLAAKESLDASLRRTGFAAWIRKPQGIAAAAALVLLAASLGGWAWYKSKRMRWAQTEGLKEIARLLAADQGMAAFDLALEVRSLIPNDAQFLLLWPEVAHTPLVESDPSGAEVYLRDRNDEKSPWRRFAVTPMKDVPLPHGYFQWRLVKPGYAEVAGAAPTWWARITFQLARQGDVPPGMVLVPGAARLGASIRGIGETAPRDSFFLDRFEVTNKEFKRFVDQGGYTKRDYWKIPFVRDGRTLSWEQAMAEFRDSTGRPGPSTWEGGSYPEGQDDYPVSGVSWYEAAAYAECVGKSLPTAYHWFRTADVRLAPFLIAASNFSGKGPARAGSHSAVSPFGAYDMAGNVKEWVWNATEKGFRMILGGGWSNPTYEFYEPDARPPFDRSPLNGFRCARYVNPPPPELTAPVRSQIREYSKEKPAGDDVVRALQSIFAYDSKPLSATADEVDDSSPYWRKEKVSFDAAYPGERVPAWLFLPKNAKPPYQVILFHPGAGAINAALASPDGFARVDFIIRSGRAVMYPIYFGTYNRRPKPPQTPLEARLIDVKRVQDLKRSVDYLLSRNDIDASRLAYVGTSWGAAWAPLMISLEQRFKTAVLFEGGLFLWRGPFPETDMLNYLPQVRIPLLMLNGRYDYIFPLAASQQYYFKWLGTPGKDKRHIVYDTAHDVMVRRTEVVREVLDWLDKYLGPVAR